MYATCMRPSGLLPPDWHTLSKAASSIVGRHPSRTTYKFNASARASEDPAFGTARCPLHRSYRWRRHKRYLVKPPSSDVVGEAYKCVCSLRPRKDDTMTEPPSQGRSAVEALPPSSYTIAWICALHFEMTAAMTMLDETHADLPSADNDRNNYTLGRIAQHNVVIACLPEGHYGTVNAARVMADLIRTFTSIRAGLMVGVGGGAPSRHNDIRLGDVVVGTRIMPYELGKVLAGGQIQHTAVQKVPDHLLCTLLSKVRATDDEGKGRMMTILRERFATRPAFVYPDLPDVLFQVDYHHDETSGFFDCDACEKSKQVLRRERTTKIPEVHYGGIASGDKLRRDGPSRDEMANALNVLCFEMETAGLMDILPCLPVRGICDYSDSHKHKRWQRYAAAVAAAYARLLLETLGVGSETRQSVPEVPSQTAPVNYDRRDAIMRALKFAQVDSRRDTIKRTHAKTCQWLLNNPTFEAWRTSQEVADHHGFLWIKGKPGTGKSTLMKFLYEKTKAAYRGDSQHLTASFFFHARGHALERSVAGMYRSLLLQLFRGFVDLQMLLDPLSDTDGECPGIEVLKQLLEEGIRALRQRRLTCFIDALDEGDEQQITEMVRYFEELAEEAIQRGVSLRICFSSRHYPYIDLRHGLRLTLEDQTGHADDLASYIYSHLRLKCPLPVTNFQDQLLERSRGVFLWAVLVVDILNKESYRGGFALMKRLKEIPSDLKSLFADMLTRDQEDMEGLRVCITWILFSKRPLTPSEFYHAMWSGTVTAGLADEVPPDTTSAEFEVGASFLVPNSSKGLAEVTTSDHPVVQFIHETVRDFLLKDNGLSEIWPDFGEAQSHDNLKRYCTSYIERVGSHVTPKKTLQSTGPFLKYSTEHVLSHAEAAAESIPQAEFLVSFPKERWIELDALVHQYRIREFKEGSRLIYILASRALPNLIRIRLEQKLDDEGVGSERYRRPFFAAISSGSHAAVAALLEASRSDLVELDASWSQSPRSMLEKTRYRTRTPLTWAVSLGFVGLAKLLVRRGADVREPDGDQVTPLMAAIQAKWEPAIRLLLGVEETSEANRSKQDLSAHTSLHPNRTLDRILEIVGSGRLGNDDLLFSPAILEEPTVTHALIDSGVGIGRRDRNGHTPLTLAVMHGYGDTVKILVQAGADVNSRIRDGSTVLSLALSLHCQDKAEALTEAGASVEFDEVQWQNRRQVRRSKIKRDHKDCARTLIEAGADTSILDSDGRSPLSLAISHGSVDIVEMLIRANADPDFQDGDGRLPFHLAVANHDSQNVSLLIDAGVDTNKVDGDGQLPLHLAVKKNYGQIASLLIDAGVDTNILDGHGRSPLALAVVHGYDEIVELLIQSKTADLNLRDADGRTVLHIAITMNHRHIVNCLVRAGASTSIFDRSGWSPLSLAAHSGRDAIVEELLQAGSFVDLENRNGWTPLQTAIERGFSIIVKLLIKAGADVSRRNEDGQTLLSLALESMHGSEAIANILIKAGADMDGRNRDGHTALQVAASCGYDSTVKLLCEAGADPNYQHTLGETALHLAVAAGHENTVRLLIDVGADASCKSAHLGTPLAVAAYANSEAVMRMLIDAGADVNMPLAPSGDSPLHATAAGGHCSAISLLLSHGARAEAQGSYGETPLHRAAKFGKEAAAKLLIKHGADVNARSSHGWSPLHLSVRGRDLDEELVKTLIESGADVEAKGDGGTTALHLSACTSSAATEMLMAEGAQVDARDVDNLTPLHWAADGRRDIALHGPLPVRMPKPYIRGKIITLLVKSEADISARDKYGQTPLHLAAMSSNQGMVRILLRLDADMNSKDSFGMTPRDVAPASMAFLFQAFYDKAEKSARRQMTTDAVTPLSHWPTKPQK